MIKDLTQRIKKFHNSIIERCSVAVGRLEDLKCNLPWEDMTDWHRGYIQAIADGRKVIEEEKIKD